MMKAFYTNVFPLPLPIKGAGKGSSIVLIPTEILKLNLNLHNGLNYRESTTAYIINEKCPAQLIVQQSHADLIHSELNLN